MAKREKEPSEKVWNRGKLVGFGVPVFNSRMEENKEPGSTDHYSRNNGVVEQQLLMRIITILG